MGRPHPGAGGRMKNAEKIAKGICAGACVGSIVCGLSAAVSGNMALTIFFSALIIALALQPDTKPED